MEISAVTDILASIPAREFEVLAERVEDDATAELLAGYLFRRALGLPVGLDLTRSHKMHQNATFDDPEAMLSGPQIIALHALLSGETRTRAAGLAGVDRTTLYRWLNRDPHFVASYHNCKAEVVGAVVARLQHLADEAVNALGDLLKQTADLPLRHRVATQILELAGVDRDTAGDIQHVSTAETLRAKWDEDVIESEIAERQAASDRKLRAAIASLGDSDNGD
jgi:hypothetical protein